MIFRQFFSLLFFALILPFCIKAQQPLLSVKKALRYSVKYHRAGSEIFIPGNTILREIAKIAVKEPRLVKIDIVFDLNLVIDRVGGNDSLSFRSANIYINGDTIYRGFGLGEVICPSRMNLMLKWANREDTTGFSEQELRNLNFGINDTILCSIPVSRFDPEVDTLLISGVELFYDSLALKSFTSRLALIHNYHASVAIIDSLKLILDEVNIHAPSMLPVNYFRISEITKALQRIDAIEFQGTLLTLGSDPVGLISRYRESYRADRTITFDFLDELGKPEEISWHGNIGRLADFYSGRILSWIRRSQLMDNLQGSIYRDFLDRYFDQSPFPEEENVTLKMLQKMFPEAKSDTLEGFFARSLYNSLQQNASVLVSVNRFTDAFTLMEFARLFASREPALRGFIHDEELQRIAAEGIYNSFVGIAAGCINTGKFAMADNYLAKADVYGRSNSQWVKSDTMYRAVFSKLFFIRNTDCDRLLENKRFNEAMDCYLAFENNYSANNLAAIRERLEEKKNQVRLGLYAETTKLTQAALKARKADTALFYDERALALRKAIGSAASVFGAQDSLAPELAKLRYEKIIASGSVALEKRQFTLSLGQFREARLLSQQYKIPSAAEFDSLYHRAIKHYLLIQLSVSQKKIWANLFDSAQIALEKTQTEANENGLSADPDLIQAMDKFKEKIREQQCSNLQDSIDLQLIRADRAVALKNYLNVTRYYHEALKLIDSNKDCHADEKSFNDSLSKYDAASGYQKNLSEVNARIAVGDYSGAINLLMENQELFRTGNLLRFGLHKVEFYEFIFSKNNPYLTETAASFLNKNGQIREAFRFLFLLMDQFVPAKQVKLLQENIGVALARADQIENPDESTVTALLGYKVAKDWFGVFKVAYSDERERLKKSLKTGLK
ncbi:MAG: hypothetical protein NT004_13455 [Bacteroidetes bacterium]|nr:hypothetical protein [Bacteroidota bacterium]